MKNPRRPGSGSTPPTRTSREPDDSPVRFRAPMRRARGGVVESGNTPRSNGALRRPSSRTASGPPASTSKIGAPSTTSRHRVRSMRRTDPATVIACPLPICVTSASKLHAHSYRCVCARGDGRPVSPQATSKVACPPVASARSTVNLTWPRVTPLAASPSRASPLTTPSSRHAAPSWHQAGAERRMPRRMARRCIEAPFQLRGVPHLSQNRASPCNGVPHLGHVTAATRGFPHFGQNCDPPVTAAPQ